MESESSKKIMEIETSKKLNKKQTHLKSFLQTDSTIVSSKRQASSENLNAEQNENLPEELQVDQPNESAAVKSETDPEKTNKKTNEIQEKHTFQSDWIENRNKKYKPYAQKSSKGKHYVYCSWCLKHVLIKNLYGKRGHLLSGLHIEKRNQYNKDKNEMDNPEITNYLTFSKKVRKIGYKFLNFIIENNLSWITIDKFLKFLKDNVDDSKIVRNLRMNRLRASELVTKCIKPIIGEKLESLLLDRPFSILLDETTDISRTQFLLILCQFWNDNDKAVDCLIHSMHDSSLYQDSDSIFEIIKKNILDKPYGKNLVGFSSDGASIFRGEHNGVVKKLQDVCSNKVWEIHCLPHCFSLIANFAARAIPEYIEKLVKDIYNHFTRSAQRTSKFMNLQIFMNLKSYKMLRLVSTRWLVLEECVNRLLTRWDELIKYFTEIAEPEFKHISQVMCEDEVKVYMQFLKEFLARLNSINVTFQQNSSQICRILPKISDEFNCICNLILKKAHRNMKLDKKFDLFVRVEELDLVSVDDEYCKNEEELASHFQFLYNDRINLLSVKSASKKVEIMRKFKDF